MAVHPGLLKLERQADVTPWHTRGRASRQAGHPKRLGEKH